MTYYVYRKGYSGLNHHQFSGTLKEIVDHYKLDCKPLFVVDIEDELNKKYPPIKFDYLHVSKYYDKDAL